MRKRFLSLLAAAAVAAAGLTAATAVTTPAPASAASCYEWSSTLSRGDSGSDVKELQIRVAGWVSHGEHLVIDGVYGPATEAAVKRFQSGYGLGADGVAGPQTFSKIYDLTSSDCTPAHFSYSEFDDNCGANNFNGGAVSASTAKENTRRVMWQLEAMRHKLGDRPIGITSGFRSYSCNSAVGGSSSSRHLYGETADMGIGANVHSQCTLYHAAWKAGFTEILGPGYSGHNDHVHVANDPSPFRSAPNC
ncbi:MULTISPECIES: M15 family metallopeptidase [Prauserella salsuginis group]|uniref:D-Ala-D-Ala carboxypeptidase family metallohydrolase n=1 Tax=Prauserella salsuginis TaxID=387889 RepID=A0ABW6G6G4_9PSEU|nr:MULTISPECIES: M15 family metallopeptidase [Prauserella salsuginis group]MCR3722827.1 zinc D-Ala-D-Ala carboxypeptidase [Prauserella flava]MCR3737118.1 zinc D-Ala-D-Ala carboxypeptidase [Prauserella salsuginis]